METVISLIVATLVVVYMVVDHKLTKIATTVMMSYTSGAISYSLIEFATPFWGIVSGISVSVFAVLTISHSHDYLQECKEKAIPG